MSFDAIAMVMFFGMMGMLLTGQRVFGAIGFVAAVSALFLWGDGGAELAFSAAMKLMKWYPLMTLPMFIYMGYIMSEARIALAQMAVSTEPRDLEMARAQLDSVDPSCLSDELALRHLLVSLYSSVQPV